MNCRGDLLRKELLEGPAARISAMLGDSGVNGLLIQHSEYLDVPLGVLVADIEPELVELVGGGLLRVEPDVTLLCLSELCAVGLLHERAGEGESVGFAKDPADQLGTGGDIAPLVASSKLEAAALVLIEPEIVISLKELVAELGEGHALA